MRLGLDDRPASPTVRWFEFITPGDQAQVRLVALPGVFRPRSDSWLLAGCLQRELRAGAAVADVCTGSGLLAVTAAMRGAGAVTAVDSSRRAVLSARLNALINGVRVEAIRGDLLTPLSGRRFDVIVSNPPYVPAATDAIPTGGAQRAWDAGQDGRALLDRLCREAPPRLVRGGTLLIVHSSVCGEARTRALLEAHGLEVDVMARETGGLGPLMAARAETLERRGLIEPGQRDEEMLVMRARARGTAPEREHLLSARVSSG